MSSIPKSKRTKSSLQVVHDAYKIRRAITDELLRNFGYNEKEVAKKLEFLANKMVQEEQREAWIKKHTEREKGFHEWFIAQERENVLNYARGIPANLIAANTIFPVNMTEFEERRLCLDKALQCCNNLMQELQYVAETLPSNKDRYANIVLDLEKEYTMIKALRKSDNRFLKHIKG